jgi:hypothetical protein
VKSSADEVARYVSAVVKAVRRQRYKGIKALCNSTLIHLYYHHIHTTIFEYIIIYIL